MKGPLFPLIAGLIAGAVAAMPGCERKEIPARGAPAGVAAAAAEAPESLLKGGTKVFSDDFERAELGASWKADHADWRIDSGWVRSESVDNAGLWLLEKLPERARVEFDAKSLPLADGKPFPGDIKCEIFATEPQHEAGYILINGGWANRLDVIARSDEHGADRKERPAAAVDPSRVYHWAIARTGDTLHWFRDGVLQMSYRDPAPIKGPYFAFNNWRTNVWFDNLVVYALD